MKQWLKEHTRAVRGAPQTWDVLAYYRGTTLVHTAVYLGDDEFFHERGCGGPWEVIGREEALSIYGTGPKYWRRMR